MKKQGILTVISGFSGAGKGTTVNKLMEMYPDAYWLSISATTRKPRNNEIPGVHYHYLSVEEFEGLIAKDGLLEYAKYGDNYYGTPKEAAINHLKDSVHVILEIEMQGALQVKKRFPEALLVFITPPTAKELEDRLRGRGTETESEIAKRLRRACEEAVYMNDYDYIVVNESGKIEECAQMIHQIICDQQQRVDQNSDLIQSMTDDLKIFADMK